MLVHARNGDRRALADARRHAAPTAGAGFTLIELVSVIVILGTLAVVALPRFINLQDEARAAALDGVAGAAGSAHALNLSAALAESEEAQPMEECRNTSDLMQGGRPEGYVFPPKSLSGPLGTPATCTVEQLATGNTATFTAYVVPP